MGRSSHCLVLLGVLSMTVGAGQAHASATPTSQGPAAGPSAPAAATHSVRGVVATVSATVLVLARSSRRAEMTFVLNQSTSRSGPIQAGTDVSVRYRIEGQQLVAAAVFVHPHSAATHGIYR
jgi:hypothetical protein